MKPLTPKAVEDYVLESERDEAGKPLADATTFRLRPLTSVDVAEIMPYFPEGENPEMNKCAPALLEVVRRGLVGWKNFGEAPFRREGKRVADSSLAFIDLTTVTELALHIWQMTTPSADELGK